MRREILALFPAGVAGFELSDGAPPPPLMAGEIDAVARAVPARVREFTEGRFCAREALALLGQAPVAIPMLPTSAPAWPAGIVGSITHCRGYCGAVVAWERDVSALGFDAEVRGTLSPSAWPDVASARELDALARDPRHDPADLVTLLFSAKEAYYKAHHVRYGSQLDFPDVEFAIVDGDTFRLTHRPGAAGAAWPASHEGRYRFDGALVFTGVAL